MHAFESTTALVTGANRGIGLALTKALLDAGVPKVYAAVRDLQSINDLASGAGGRVHALRLDVTDQSMIDVAAAAVDDVNLLINNAGVAAGRPDALLDDPDALVNARNELEVNYIAPLSMARAFAPILRANGGGTVVNILSIAGLSNFPSITSYSASKAAAHSLTQGLRSLLRNGGTRVIGVYPGPVDTDMARGVEMPKASPEEVAETILTGIREGEEWIYPDEMAEQLGRRFERGPRLLEQAMAETGDA